MNQHLSSNAVETAGTAGSGLRLLQATIGILALVPVLAGLAGIARGPSFVEGQAALTPSLDSHFSYLSGLLLALGFGFWSTIPSLAIRGKRLRLLGLIVIGGGLGRLVSLFRVGLPDASMLCGLGIELGLTPLILLWHWRLTRH